MFKHAVPASPDGTSILSKTKAPRKGDTVRTIICDLTHAQLAATGVRHDVALCREELSAARDCTGCFGCWVRTPGSCVIRDSLGDLGVLLARTDELLLVSRMTFGWVSPHVKRALDRSIGYLHPNFRIADGQLHHRMRYADHELALSFHLYGPSTGAERACARTIAAANALNLGARLASVRFPADEKNVDAEKDAPAVAAPAPPEHGRALPRRVALVNASPRGGRSATAHLLADLAEALPVYARRADVAAPELVRATAPTELAGCDAVVLGYSLYVDALPSGLVDLLVCARDELAAGTRVYALANMGFYEPEQIVPSFSVIENFCAAAGARWSGGVAVGAGGMVLPVAQTPRMGMMRRSVSEAIDRLIMAVLAGTDAGAIEARPPVPRFAYKLAAEARWRRLAREHGAAI